MVLVTVYAGLDVSAPRLRGRKEWSRNRQTTNHRTWSSVDNSVCLPMTRQTSVEAVVFTQI